MTNPYQMRFDFYKTAWDQLICEYHADIYKMEAEKTSNFPKFPTVEQTIELAEKIKNFTEKK